MRPRAREQHGGLRTSPPGADAAPRRAPRSKGARCRYGPSGLPAAPSRGCPGLSTSNCPVGTVVSGLTVGAGLPGGMQAGDGAGEVGLSPEQVRGEGHIPGHLTSVWAPAPHSPSRGLCPWGRHVGSIKQSDFSPVGLGPWATPSPWARTPVGHRKTSVSGVGGDGSPQSSRLQDGSPNAPPVKADSAAHPLKEPRRSRMEGDPRAGKER